MVDDTDKFRTLSLFSGIAGIEIGLSRWCKTICYCEIDPYACAVLIKNMAKGNLDIAPIWGDVTTFGRSEIEAVGPIECITGGFPCQDISCAGKGAGIHGERSGLFFEIIRIVRMARPQIIFLENAPALLARGMDIVLRELSESGYDARWKVLSAAEVGAPHIRDRLWILAYTNEIRCKELLLFKASSDKKYHKWAHNTLLRPIDCFGRRRIDLAGYRRCNYGLPTKMDFYRYEVGGNAVMPQCAEKAFEILMNFEANK